MSYAGYDNADATAGGATPSANALGSLLGFSPDQLQALIAQLGPQQADKDAARQQAILTASLGLLGARKGFEFDKIGQAGQQGVQAYQGYLQNAIKQRQEALPQVMALRQMAMQNQAMQATQGILNGTNQPQTSNGPPAPFQQPGGAAATMNGALGGAMPPPAQLPTQNATPPNPMNVRQALTRANLVQTMAGMPDKSAAINAMFPNSISGRPGGYLQDPMTGQLTYLPKIPEGADYKTDENGNKIITMIPGAMGAKAADAAATAAGSLSLKAPNEQVGPGGVMQRPPGSALDQVTGGGSRMPYGIPSPYGASPLASSMAPGGPSAPAPSAAPQSGPQGYQTKLSPEQDKRSADLAAQRGDLDARARAAQSALARLDVVDSLADTIHPGQFNAVRQTLGRVFTDLGFDKDSVDKAFGSVAGNQIFGKNAGQIAIDQTAGTGQSAWGALRDIAAANPNATMTPEAIHGIVGEMKAILSRNGPDMQTASKAWLADPKNNGSYEGFEENYNRTQPMTGKMPQPDVRSAVKVAPQVQNNSTLKAIMANQLTPAQLDKLRAKGYVQ